MDREQIEAALEGSEFFRGFEKENLKDIVGLCRMEGFDIGEYVFQQGDFGEHLYVVAQGKINLERSMDMGQRKGSVVIEALGKGRVLGCWSTLLGEPHVLMSSAVCQKPTRVVVMKGSDLRNVMVSNTDLGFQVMERFCFLLRDRIQAAYGALEKI